MKIRNIIKAVKDQGPLQRFFRSFFVTRNGWGLISKRSHFRDNGDSKVMYNTKLSAEKAASKMSEKHGVHFSNYKCLYCDGYHLGKNRDNKVRFVSSRGISL